MLKKKKQNLLRSIRKQQIFQLISKSRKHLFQAKKHIEEDFDLKNKLAQTWAQIKDLDPNHYGDVTEVWLKCVSELNLIFREKDVFSNLELQSFLDLSFFGKCLVSKSWIIDFDL